MTERGKFIVIYGSNNLGKSEQARRLVGNLNSAGKKVRIVKYPIYDNEPSGPQINAVLREGKEMSELDLQKLFAQNRRDTEVDLKRELDEEGWVVGEDYKGTGIAWGVTNNIPLEVMEEINEGLLDEDLAILLDGERFKDGIETGHRNEEGENWDKSRQVHKGLALRYGWKVVRANQTKEQVEEDIWVIVQEELFK